MDFSFFHQLRRHHLYWLRNLTICLHLNRNSKRYSWSWMVSSFEKRAFHMCNAPQRTDLLLRYNLNVGDVLFLKFLAYVFEWNRIFSECNIHRNHPIPVLIHFWHLIDFNNSFVSGTRIIRKLRTTCELLRIFLPLFQCLKKLFTSVNKDLRIA